jgi:heptosyltransferase-3
LSLLKEIFSRLPMLRDRAARRRIRVMLKLTPVAAWQIFRLRRAAAAQGKTLHLILHPGSLGDVVAAEQAASALAAPRRFLVWLINPLYAPILRHIPWLDAVVPMAGTTEWRVLRRLFPGVATSIFYPDGAPCPWLGIALPNPNPDGLTIANYYDHDSLAAVYAKVAGVAAPDRAPRLYCCAGTDNETILQQIGLVSEFAVIACRSYDASRSFPAASLQEVADWLMTNTSLSLVEAGLDPVLQPRPRIIQPRGGIAIDQQAVLLSRAKIFLGVDSGFSHIANALGVPAVILLGRYKTWTRYNPFSGPWALGQGCTILRADGPLSELGSGTVIGALRQRLAMAQS